MNDLIDRLLAGPQPDRHSGVIMEEAADEIERLSKCLKWQQDRDATVSTHGPECYTWGNRHYECALREIDRLRAVMEQSEAVGNVVEWVDGSLIHAWFGEPPEKGTLLYTHPPKPDTEELEALRRDRNGWKDVADMGEKIIASRDEQLTRYRAVMEQAVEAISQIGQSLSWHCFGECRGWHDYLPEARDAAERGKEAITALSECLGWKK